LGIVAAKRRSASWFRVVSAGNASSIAARIAAMAEIGISVSGTVPPHKAGTCVP
jgi:hypothetical protein